MSSYIITFDDQTMDGAEIPDLDSALAAAQTGSENDGKTRTIWETRAIKRVVAEPVQKYTVHVEDVA